MKGPAIPVKYLAVAAMVVAVVLGLIKLDVWYTTRQSSAQDGMTNPDELDTPLPQNLAPTITPDAQSDSEIEAAA